MSNLIESNALANFAARVVSRFWILLIAITAPQILGCGNSDRPTEDQRSENSENADPSGTKTSPPIFKDVTKEVGLTFQHSLGAPESYHFPDIMVGGCGVIDYNNDGLMDLILVDSGDFSDVLSQSTSKRKGNSNRLFRQTPDGNFVDETSASGLIDSRYGSGVAVADVNNDGFSDVLFTNYGDDQLFINLGNSTFRNATSESGIRNPGWSTSATFLDYNADGKLDLFITSYVSYLAETNCATASGPEDFCSPRVFSGTADKLYENVSTESQIKFRDVSLQTGIASRKGPGLGVISGDFSGDGLVDLYVANDGAANFLWVNQNGEKFTESASAMGCANSISGQAQAGMGVMAGDIDGNGVLDLLITHLDGETNAAYFGQANLTAKGKKQIFYAESAGATGIQKLSAPMTGFGVGLVDLDNDGDVDTLTANGRVTRRNKKLSKPFWSDYAERNQIAMNDGTGKFKEHDAQDPFLQDIAVSRGLALVDFDNDGKLDCLITNTAGAAKLYRNCFQSDHHWIGFQLTLPDCGNRQAIGAQMILTTDTGKKSAILQTDGSYLSCRDPRIHFGLGKTESVEYAIIKWPDGSTEKFIDLKVDTYQTLAQGTGKSSPNALQESP